jgi:hypothetical protein
MYGPALHGVEWSLLLLLQTAAWLGRFYPLLYGRHRPRGYYGGAAAAWCWG